MLRLVSNGLVYSGRAGAIAFFALVPADLPRLRFFPPESSKEVDVDDYSRRS